MSDRKRTSIFIAILWTVCLVLDVVSCGMGNAPTWFSVFCPVACLALTSWIEVITNDRY